jgi:hypothetical protein
MEHRGILFVMKGNRGRGSAYRHSPIAHAMRA